MTLDGKIFCFTSAATVGQLLEVPLKKIKGDRDKEREGMG
jgi:hypothetical protein